MGGDRRPRARNHEGVPRSFSPEGGGITPSSPDSKDDFQETTRRFWEERYGRPLSDEELREITQNTVEFTKILLEWEEKAKALTDHGDGKSALPEKSTQHTGEEGTDKP